MATNRSRDGVDLTLEVLDGGSLAERILAATPRCIARWGIGKTTLDDVAREAGCGRASIYRLFPGGKEEVVEAAARYEEGRFFAGLVPELEAAETLEDLLVVGFVGASRHAAQNPAITYLLEHEPELVLPRLLFDRVGPLLYRVSLLAGPYLERFLEPDAAAETAEWVTRLVVSYGLGPSDHLDPCDPDDARRFVRTYVMPGLQPDSNHATDPKGESHVLH
jgi:AcrR family transcriptional regulator